LQATHAGASKGEALKRYVRFKSHRGVVIAAGDDENDKSMLEVADIKVVMGTAPQDMKEKADVIAPPASVGGLVEGLQKAIEMSHGH
jgi:hydroxymethylpyrimidine pyrophosphatase-like HAD family hydrolase